MNMSCIARTDTPCPEWCSFSAPPRPEGRFQRRFAPAVVDRVLMVRALSHESPWGPIDLTGRVDFALRLNVHYHVWALEGVHVADEHSLRFLPLPTPTRAEVADIARRTADRIEKILRAHGRSFDPEQSQ